MFASDSSRTSSLRSLNTATCAVIVALGLFTVLTTLSAQDGKAPPCDDGMTPKTFGDMVVVRTCSGGTTQAPENYSTTTKAELTEKVIVLVRDLGRFVAAQNEIRAKTPANAVDLTKVVLFLNGQPLKGVEPRIPSAQFSHFEFVLKRDPNMLKDEKTREAWTGLLSDGVRRRPVTLSVGFEGQAPLRTEVENFTLVAVPSRWGFVWGVFAAGLFALLIWVGRKSNALRDSGPEPAPPGGGGAAPRKAYSLARVQMAAWFFVVLIAYVLIWTVTGGLDTLTPTVLGLMGISAATTVAGGALDANPDPAGAAPQPNPATRGFFTDLVSDKDGVKLPRLQTAMWTAVLIIIFLTSVERELAMPTFDATLLGLMGISNGTYLAMKGTEK